MATLVLLGDTRSLKNIARIKELGWGRMFAGYKPTPYDGEKWGFDNGAYKHWTDGMPFDEARFKYRLTVAAAIGHPHLAVCPDIVAGGCSSLGFSLKWIEWLHAYGEQSQRPSNPAWPSRWDWYLAVQNGMTIHDVKPHLEHFAGIFLGGDDGFKAQAWRWRVFAKDHGKPFHYGRAGTLPKLESALKMKADSLDSSYPLWETKRMEKFIAMYQYLQGNPRPTLGEKVMGLNVQP
jgi:hypothetical protein